ncbi:MAG: oligosaccharide flippase family protein [Bacteroidales bacterium]
MHRKFLTNLGLMLFVNILIKPFWILGIDRTVQNVVGPVDYGFYYAVFNFSFLFNILLDFGITNFNNKNISQNNHLLNKHFSGIVVIKFLFAVVYMMVTLTAGLVWGYDSHQMLLLVILGLNQFLISFILYLRSNISGLLHFKTDSFISVLDRILMILICSVLLWGNVTSTPFRIEWFVYTQSAAYLLTALAAVIVVGKKASFRKLKWDKLFFLMIIKKSFPFAILGLLMTFYNRIDSVMMERMLPGWLGDLQTGIYAMAYRLLDASNMIAYLFAVLLLPIFARMIKLGESVQSILKLSFTLLFTLSVAVAAASFFYSYEIMDLLYDHHVADAAFVFRLLMIDFIAVSTTYVFGTLLTANGSLKIMNILAASGMFINIVLNLFFIPQFMAQGAAVASLITQFIIAALQVFIVIKTFRLKTNIRYLFNLTEYVSGVILISFLSRLLPFDWKISFLSLLLVSAMLAFMLRLLDIRSLFRQFGQPSSSI